MIKKLKKEQLLIGALFGILCLIIAIPVSKEEKAEQKIEDFEGCRYSQAVPMEQQLESVLQTISGVGKVKVFITYADSGKLIVEKDEVISEELIQEADSVGGTRTTTTTQNDRQTVYDTGENPYVVQELSPKIEGVLIVAQGAGNETIKKQIQQTMEALFGLDAHKISIMKMEVSK